MAPSSTREDTRARKAFVWIAVVALLLAAALTGAWYYLAGRLDAEVRAAIDKLGGQGVVVACENQEVFGYPFRIGLRCDSLGVEAPRDNFRGSAGELRTAAQIYRPTQVIAEADGPLMLAIEGVPPLDIRWNLVRASAHFWTNGLDRLSLVAEAPVVALAEAAGATQPLARSDHLELHVRRRGDSLDLAFSDRGIKALEAAYTALPAFDIATDITIDQATDLTIDDAANWIFGRHDGRTPGEALAGKSGAIRALGITLAGGGDAASAGLSGPFSIAEDGAISGAFDLVVADPRKIGGLVATLAPQLAGVAGSIASGIGFAGKTENGRTTIRITVDDGNASLGVIPLGKIPPLR